MVGTKISACDHWVFFAGAAEHVCDGAGKPPEDVEEGLEEVSPENAASPPPIHREPTG